MSALRASTLEEVTPRQRAVITFLVVAATLIQLLDTTIVNVAVPHMKGQLSATPEQISWVLTSYVVVSSIFMPLTGYFSDKIGVRPFLAISIGGFTLASLFCGLSTSLNEIVAFRILQGVFGAALVPLSQTILIHIYPPQERGKAMGIWSMGIMVGPILGPALGGILTEKFSWHWIFFINVPIGALLLLLTLAVMPNSESKIRKMDWTGFALMGLAIASAQLVLDLGQREDWFASNLIRNLALVALVSFMGFIWHGLTKEDDPIFDLRMLKDRYFFSSVTINAVMFVGFYASSLLLPLMMVEVLGFNIMVAGLVLAPRGMVTIFSSILAGHLMKRMDGRKVLAMGILINAFGTLPMTLYTADINFWWVVIPSLIQGMGIGMMIVSLSTLAYSSLPASKVGEASGVFGLLRSFGGSVGIAVIAAFFARHAQIAWGQLRGGVSEASKVVEDWQHGTGFDGASPETWQILSAMVEKQSQMIAYVDSLKFIVGIFFCLFPLLLLYKLPVGARQEKAPTTAGSRELA